MTTATVRSGGAGVQPRRIRGKRAMDVLGAGAGLVLTSPVLAAVAAAVRLDSPGPVFFRQTRVGIGGREFRIHKFRTMHVERPGERRDGVTATGDPRITRVGAVLRRTKLDELPQLLDVLVGDMSLVGPRPEIPRYVELWDPRMREEILSVCPGITDPASLAGLDEGAELAAAEDPETYYVTDLLPRKQAMYVDYVRSASLTGDLRLVARTVLAVLRR